MKINRITPSFAYTQNTTPVTPENQSDQRAEDAVAQKQYAVSEQALVRADAENRTDNAPRSRREERRGVDIVA